MEPKNQTLPQWMDHLPTEILTSPSSNSSPSSSLSSSSSRPSSSLSSSSSRPNSSLSLSSSRPNSSLSSSSSRPSSSSSRPNSSLSHPSSSSSLARSQSDDSISSSCHMPKDKLKLNIPSSAQQNPNELESSTSDTSDDSPVSAQYTLSSRTSHQSLHQQARHSFSFSPEASPQGSVTSTPPYSPGSYLRVASPKLSEASCNTKKELQKKLQKELQEKLKELQEKLQEELQREAHSSDFLSLSTSSIVVEHPSQGGNSRVKAGAGHYASQSCDTTKAFKRPRLRVNLPPSRQRGDTCLTQSLTNPPQPFNNRSSSAPSQVDPPSSSINETQAPTVELIPPTSSTNETQASTVELVPPPQINPPSSSTNETQAPTDFVSKNLPKLPSFYLFLRKKIPRSQAEFCDTLKDTFFKLIYSFLFIGTSFNCGERFHTDLSTTFNIWRTSGLLSKSFAAQSLNYNSLKETFDGFLAEILAADIVFSWSRIKNSLKDQWNSIHYPKDKTSTAPQIANQDTPSFFQKISAHMAKILWTALLLIIILGQIRKTWEVFSGLIQASKNFWKEKTAYNFFKFSKNSAYSYYILFKLQKPGPWFKTKTFCSQLSKALHEQVSDVDELTSTTMPTQIYEFGRKTPEQIQNFTEGFSKLGSSAKRNFKIRWLLFSIEMLATMGDRGVKLTSLLRDISLIDILNGSSRWTDLKAALNNIYKMADATSTLFDEFPSIGKNLMHRMTQVDEHYIEPCFGAIGKDCLILPINNFFAFQHHPLTSTTNHLTITTNRLTITTSHLTSDTSDAKKTEIAQTPSMHDSSWSFTPLPRSS